MVLIRVPQIWDIPESQITPESAFLNRRKFIQQAIAAGIGVNILSVMGCQNQSKANNDPTAGTESLGQVPVNPNFAEAGRPITDQSVTSRYNNFYEFGGTKSIWRAAQALPTEDWKIEVTGLVNKPKTYDLDDLRKKFSLEKRVYRFRCVEAWAMVVPWIGFPMKRIIEDVDPTNAAKFVRFSSYYDPNVTPGPWFFFGFFAVALSRRLAH